jgi:uncharacterized membrane protein YeaQ/YmgE (transglycosylase-associated protein family)
MERETAMTDDSRVFADDDPRRDTDHAADLGTDEVEALFADPASGETDIDPTPVAAGPRRRPGGDHDVSDPTPDEAIGGAHGDDTATPTVSHGETATPTVSHGDTVTPTVSGGTDHRPGPAGLGHVPEHDAPDWWRIWLRRTSIALLATLALATLLIWSWVGGLHAPSARGVPVGVVAGDAPAIGAVRYVQNDSHTLKPVYYRTAQAATNALSRRQIAAILATDAAGLGGGLNLTIASAAGPGVATAVAGSLEAVTNQVGVPLVIEDIHPVSARDPSGRTPFYLTLAWVLGGMLAAIILGVVLGTIPRDLDRLAMRLAALFVFSLLLGLIGALLAGPILGVWDAHTFGLWLTGALIVFTAALIASALQSWLGLWGIGIVVLLLLVLGVPAAGGLIAPDLMPGFFRGMQRWNPVGLGTDLVRGLEYFGRNANGWPITGLTLWSLASIAALIGSTIVLGKHARDRFAATAAAPGVGGT